jgi:hypothetical protein
MLPVLPHLVLRAKGLLTKGLMPVLLAKPLMVIHLHLADHHLLVIRPQLYLVEDQQALREDQQALECIQNPL